MKIKQLFQKISFCDSNLFIFIQCWNKKYLFQQNGICKNLMHRYITLVNVGKRKGYNNIIIKKIYSKRRTRNTFFVYRFVFKKMQFHSKNWYLFLTSSFSPLAMLLEIQKLYQKNNILQVHFASVVGFISTGGERFHYINII